MRIPDIRIRQKWPKPVSCLICMIIFISAVVSCGSKEDKKEIPQGEPEVAAEPGSDPASSGSGHRAWFSLQVTGSDSLGRVYTDSAVKIFPDGKFITGNASIKAHYSRMPAKAVEIMTDTLIIASDQYTYEIGGFIDSQGKMHKHLIIWDTTEDLYLRELEMIAPVSSFISADEILEARRQEWMLYCNTHEINDLVDQLYSPKALYYNHKPMIEGREALLAEYAYMRQTEYELELLPEYIVQANEDIAFEIGQCSGSYKGKYILVWKKEAPGRWYVLMDSNI